VVNYLKNIRRILITGGAGFIGSHLADGLLEQGYDVRVLDNLEPQVHGALQQKPEYLKEQIEFVKGDIQDRNTIRECLEGIDAIFHFAANVGIGQSMYQIANYISVNTTGTANLLDCLVHEEHTVKKVIVASSMSIYGEGKYSCPNCGVIFPKQRETADLQAKLWELKCPTCSALLTPLPTDESKPLYPSSIYAQSKRHQEEMVLLVGETYGIPTVALRFFNVYGPRQALSNPYTGVCAIFSSRLKNHTPPVIYEDGLQSRDFIHIHDLVAANLLALTKQAANYEIFNVGTGVPVTILEIAQVLIDTMQIDIEPQIINQFRKGDIRHCFADISKIRNTLNFKPKISFQEGIHDLITWVTAQTDVEDKFPQVHSELNKYKLTID
jgi:dTDP-L-rhamnose 4-epimerase